MTTRRTCVLHRVRRCSHYAPRDGQTPDLCRDGETLLTSHSGPRFTDHGQLTPNSARYAAAQVGDAPQAKPPGDLSEPLPTRQEATAHQPAGAQLLEPRLPGFGARSQPNEDLGYSSRNRRLALAEQPHGVIDQQQVAAQRKVLIEKVPAAGCRSNTYGRWPLLRAKTRAGRNE